MHSTDSPWGRDNSHKTLFVCSCLEAWLVTLRIMLYMGHFARLHACLFCLVTRVRSERWLIFEPQATPSFPAPAVTLGRTPSPPSQGPAINPWDFLQAKEGEAVEHEIQAKPELTVIEPVIKSQYLTKLKRLLPTYLEEMQDEQNSKRMKELLLGDEGRALADI